MIKSSVGHVDTAALFARLLGRDVPVNRIGITLDPDDDQLLVGQYVGPRLPEGTSELPKGSRVIWVSVTTS